MSVDFGGGSAGADPLAGYDPQPLNIPHSGGPFINWHSPLSVVSSPFRAAYGGAKATEELMQGAARGLLSIPVVAGQELYRDARQPLFDRSHRLPFMPSDEFVGAKDPQAALNAYAKEHPLTGGLLSSFAQTGQHVEQLARAGGNTVLPGQPLGSNVGQLGSGAGLLGNTDYAHAAARGGGGVAPLALGDVTNLSLLGGPVEALVGNAAEGAAAEAATHASTLSDVSAAAKDAERAAEANVKQASQQYQQAVHQRADLARAAASGHPADAAAFQAADQGMQAAGEALRQAQAAVQKVAAEHGANVDLAQQVADEAQGHADTLQQRLKTVKTVAKLGSTAAASPFAPLEYGLPRILGAAAPLAHALVDSPILGEKFLQPAIDRAHNFAAQIEANRAMRDIQSTGEEQKQSGESVLRRGFAATGEPLPTVEQDVRRGPLGLFGHKTVTVADLDAQAVADMSKTIEGGQLGGLVRRFGPEEGTRIFAEASKTRYTPEQLDLAAEVYGPEADHAISEKAAAVREAIPAVREAYARPGGALEFQNKNYEELRGEAGVGHARPEPGAGAFGQVEHNLYGDTANIEHLDQWHEARAKYERDVARQEKVLGKAGKALIGAHEAVDRLGMSEAERANPRVLFDRLNEGPTAGARAIIAYGPHVWDAMAAAPEKGVAQLGEAVRSGKLDPEAATQRLADQIIKLARKDPDKLSPVALTLVEEARQHGMGDVGPEARVANAASATQPAQRIGVGTERARAGEATVARATADMARGDEMVGQAGEKMAAPTRARTAAVQAAHDRVVGAATKLSDLLGRVNELGAKIHASNQTDELGAAGMSHADVVREVLETRRAVAAELDAEAKAGIEDLERDGIPKMKWPPPTVEQRIMNRSGDLKGRDVVRRVYDPNYANAIENLTESGDKYGRTREPKVIERGKKSGQMSRRQWVPDPRFFSTDGATPEEIEHAMDLKANGAYGVGLEGGEWGGAAASAGASRVSGQGVEEWLDRVERIRNAERDAGTLPGITKAQREEIIQTGWANNHDALGRLQEAFAGRFGQEAALELARHVLSGDPKIVANTIGKRLNEFFDRDVLQDKRTARDEAVSHALEVDRQNEQERGTVGAREGRSSLDKAGKALYDQQVAADKAGVQGQIVGQRERQFGAQVSAGAESARTQGQSEGALLGRGQQLGRTAEADVARGDRQAASGRAILGQAPELAQETQKRVAGPVGQMYREVGKREQTLADATARYMKEQRAMERLDEGLAAKQRELEQSVEAAPRAMRPVLELGQRIRDVVTPLADQADKDYGPGAGDEYRNAAAEATILSAEGMKRFGLDPQFIIGEREGVQVPGTARAVDTRGGAPVAGRTGQREAGTGLLHPIGHEAQFRAARSRYFQMIDNEKVQKVQAGWGENLGDALQRRGVDIEGMSRRELQQTLKDQRLVAWDVADRRGGLLPNSQIDAETRVVPLEVWKAWQRYQENVKPDSFPQTMLRGYDKATRGLKRAIRLSPRWNASIAAGHMIMGTIGADFDIGRYFSHDMPTAARLLKITEAGGPEAMSAEDQAWVQTLHPDIQRAIADRSGVPGSVYNRGFVRAEFPSSEAERTKLGHRPLAMQSKLDNLGRTAVWVHKLEEGLDGQGLADFRAQYPDMAHLSDSEIQNEAAIRLSIRTFGDYLNSTQFEKNVMGRTLFFYPWLKHITKLALNTAIHNPLRTAWLMHLGQMFSPGNTPVNFLQDSYSIGNNRWITPPSWNPFASMFGFTDNPVGGLNPMVAAGIGGATGFNTRTGKPITRPWFENGGRLGAGEFANFAANQLPYVQAARESIPALFGGQAVARYQTGQPIITKGGEIPSNETQWLGSNTLVPGALAPWMPQFGLPYQRTINTDEIIQRQLAAQTANAKAAKKYAVRRALLGGS